MTSEGAGALFHPDLPVILLVLFLALCCLVGVLMPANRTDSPIRLAVPITVTYWAVWTVVFGLFGSTVYGWPIALTLAAIAVGTTLYVVYLIASNLRSGLAPVGTLVVTVIEIVGVGILGSALVPLLLLTLVIILGVDGP